jgi:hypothetical protein
MSTKKKAPEPPAPPKKAEAPTKVLDLHVTMPETIQELIDACGMVAVFIPTRSGIRFFITQNFTQPQADEFAAILEDCAKTVRGLYRPTGGTVQ